MPVIAMCTTELLFCSVIHSVPLDSGDSSAMLVRTCSGV